MQRNKNDIFSSHFRRPHPIHHMFHNHSWPCCCTTSQTGHPLAGGNVSVYLGRVLIPSTLHTYGSGRWRYLAFSTQANLQPVPLEEHTLRVFAVQLAKEGLTHQTIRSYLSAVLPHHSGAGRSICREHFSPCAVCTQTSSRYLATQPGSPASLSHRQYCTF